MAENLKVNAKTKILTFKKKHNLLADKVDGLEETVEQNLLPEIESGDAGKVITVNENEDGYILSPVSGGEKLYMHYLFIGAQPYTDISGRIKLMIISKNSQPFTRATLAQYLYNKNIRESSKGIRCDGEILPTSNEVSIPLMSPKLFAPTSNNLSAYMAGVIRFTENSTTINQSYSTVQAGTSVFEDIVVEIQ